MGIGAPGAAILRRMAGAEQALGARFRPQRAIHHPLLLEARVVRHDLGLAEALGHRAQQRHLLGPPGGWGHVEYAIWSLECGSVLREWPTLRRTASRRRTLPGGQI